IIVAKRAGFCFGVKRAVEMAFNCKNEEKKAYSLGPIIHNPQVVDKLMSYGVHPLEETDIPKLEKGDTIIIRTHGIPLETFKRLDNKGLNIIDATCPFVKKAQKYAQLLNERGYQVLIVGDKDHPEVKGLMSYAGKNVIVVNSENFKAKLNKKVGIVVQTTQPKELLKKIVNRVLENVKELVIHNTICDSTDLRLKETISLADKVDIMFVVGGKNSANTTQLTKLCLSKNIPTYHIETSKEINAQWLKDKRSIGITAGASTPDWIIDEVKNSIKDIGGMA
ncbi:MAG: 4-hydroxy-3-methylbut-2-enyl diphosphate reductase, partial [Thermodesulfovibrionales bacterium]|nr:4-hydroxy-3-methylbut-2-enyl diphosphate reductase [Thermodesulfovibrionales bacterium]